MKITPPFGYRNVKALNKTDFVRYSDSKGLPPFVKETAVVPLSAGEMIAAAWHYPLVFVRDSTADRVGLVAMLGLAAGENLFHGVDGWRPDSYMPAYVRRYPFCMARVTIDGQDDPNLLVCVEKEYVAKEAKEGCRQLFDRDGNATDEWKGIEAFLKEYEADLARTSAFCAALVEQDLLEPLTATITQPGKSSWNVTGFLGVNEGKLRDLPNETVGEWHRNGWLSRIALHLFSLQRMQELLKKQSEYVESSATNESSGE
ncbi:SapC family protein [Burkholderia territorii]|uniref:SapC family protein n=1 Tax=Burkholderia territorii TaxID=1503055 RepID=UPI00076BDE4F|nr:SapC family protein [Burkholderia territorii]KWA07864.1 hypothetical protein WT37_26620 [Burkholderia territorii]